MSKLLARTRELLADRSAEELHEIAKATGLTYGWLNQVKYKPDISPAVDKIEKLYEHLSGQKLEVK